MSDEEAGDEAKERIIDFTIFRDSQRARVITRGDFVDPGSAKRKTGIGDSHHQPPRRKQLYRLIRNGLPMLVRLAPHAGAFVRRQLLIITNSRPPFRWSGDQIPNRFRWLVQGDGA